MTAWTDCMTAVAELDTVRRTSAAAVASQEHAARSRTGRFGWRTAAGSRCSVPASSIVAGRARRTPPPLEPQTAERTTAAALVTAPVADPTPGVNAALSAARVSRCIQTQSWTIVADGPPGDGLLPRCWNPARRQPDPVRLVRAARHDRAHLHQRPWPETRRLPSMIELVFDLTVPFGAFLHLSIASISLLFAAGNDGRKPKSMGYGLLICAIPLFVGIVVLGRF